MLSLPATRTPDSLFPQWPASDIPGQPPVDGSLVNALPPRKRKQADAGSRSRGSPAHPGTQVPERLNQNNQTLAIPIMQTLSIAGSRPPPASRERSAQDALVAFVSHSKASSRLLRLLSRNRKPIGYKALMDEIRFGGKSSPHDQDLPASALRAVLWISQLAGLVSLTRQGFSITEIGREVQRRIELGPATSPTSTEAGPLLSFRRRYRRQLQSVTSFIRRVLNPAQVRNPKPHTERNSPMYLATEATTTFTVPEFLFAAAQAAAFMFVLLWAKLAHDRRGMKAEPTGTAAHSGSRKPQQRSERWRRRRVGMTPSSRPLPSGAMPWRFGMRANDPLNTPIKTNGSRSRDFGNRSRTRKAERVETNS